ncbi:YciI family protein [Kiloniella antarctica]|uniref:YciI family protein n=1 Tax=Kiloniella antarctica TaxID=1550907 RepID=A0ABW5BJQ8_9PROT
MFVIQLKFSDNKSQASQFMDGHKEWIKQGFNDGVFLVVGSLQPNLGGGILAHATTMAELQNRVSQDPFVAQNIVTTEISEITPAKTDERLKFLLDESIAT